MGGSRGTVLLALLVLLTLTACTSSPEPSGTSSPTRRVAPSSSAPSDPTPDPPRPRTVRIALAGDVHFEGVLADRLADPESALAPAASTLAAADLAILNLETSLGTGGRPEPGKRFTFSAPASALTALAAAGVDVVSMANNHALDHGRGRLPSTFAAIADADRLQVVGMGRNAEAAFRPAVVDVAGVRVATLAASVADQDPTADRTGHWAATAERPGVAMALDPTRLVQGVRGAARRADVVVVYLHWGVQGRSCPSEDQRRLATRLEAAGADVIAGSHAHVLQGDGRLGQAYVAYGLGNYVWYSPGTTGVLTLTVRPPGSRAGHARVTRARWDPSRIQDDGLPLPLGPQEAAAFETSREALRECSGLGR